MTPASTLLTNDTAGAEFETAAEEKRAASFRSVRLWRETPLLWTITRETLYFWLRVPAPRLPENVREAYAAAKEAQGTAKHGELLRLANELYGEFQARIGPDNSYYRNAIIILYLAVHQSKDWQAWTSDRSAFLCAIEEWADRSIDSGEMVAVSEVTDLLIQDAEANRAVPRPKDTKGFDEVGN